MTTDSAASSQIHPARDESDNGLGLPTMTMIGGGQLARMTAQAAISFGQSVLVVSESEHESASLVAARRVPGAASDTAALIEAAKQSVVVTFDHEHVPAEVLNSLTEAGVNFQPPASALLLAQDKLVMRQRLSEMGLRVPAFSHITNAETLEEFWESVQSRVVLKTTRGGYDGKGVWMPETFEQALDIAKNLDFTNVLAEEKILWSRELSAMVARSPEGQVAAWPVVQTVQRDGVCVETIAPAQELSETLATQAVQTAITIAEQVGVTGVMAVELFVDTDAHGNEQDIVINELAMRPHNSGHWSMDGAITSQFEQHMRAVLDYPLGSPDATSELTVMANVLGAQHPSDISMDQRIHLLCGRFPQAKIHLYGKSERPGRKLGHVNMSLPRGVQATPETTQQLRHEANLAAQWLSTGVWEDNFSAH